MNKIMCHVNYSHLTLNQFHKGNKSCIPDASVIKLNKHSCVTTRHNCFKVHEVPLYCCLVMTQFVDFKAIIMMIQIYYKFH